MKEILLQLAQYNLWANKQLTKLIDTLGEETTNREIISSFSSIRLTLQHLKDVEWIWWQRLKLIDIAFPLQQTVVTIPDLSKELLTLSAQWVEWIEKCNLMGLEHEFAYRNSKKEQFKQPVYQMLVHLFNHQTYHRGQLVTLLRQTGLDKIPANDFIEWSRR